jgi:hypothetical protein
LVFPTRRVLTKEIIPTMVDRCLDLYVWLLLATTPITMATFHLWMSMTPLLLS